MMAGLVDENGKYRTGRAGIVNATAERYIKRVQTDIRLAPY